MTLQSFGFWRYGKEYFEAYLIIDEKMPDSMVLFSVKFFLLGHALEAVLKSYLLSNNVTEAQLKRNYGHDLDLLVKTTLSLGLENIVVLTQEEIDLIKLLNKLHINKETQYPRIGNKLVPHFFVIENIVEKLIIALHIKRYPSKPVRILDEIYPPRQLPIKSWNS